MVNLKLHRRSMLAGLTDVLLSSTMCGEPSITAPAQRAKNVDSRLSPSGALEVVASFTDPVPSAIAITLSGRAFIGFPRHVDDHTKAKPEELRDGRLITFPNFGVELAFSSPSPLSGYFLPIVPQSTLLILNFHAKAWAMGPRLSSAPFASRAILSLPATSTLTTQTMEPLKPRLECE